MAQNALRVTERERVNVERTLPPPIPPTPLPPTSPYSPDPLTSTGPCGSVFGVGDDISSVSV